MEEIIKLLVDRVSQYGFLVNLIPGTALCLLLEWIGYDIIPAEGFYISFFVFYFVGVVSNRFGSLFVESILKKMNLVTFISYEKFVEAERKDSKVSTLSMKNNAFRSYIAVFFLSLVALLYKDIDQGCLRFHLVILLVFLLSLFVISYEKQTDYVKRRVEIVLKSQTQ